MPETFAMDRVGVRPDHLGKFLDQVRAADRTEPLWSALVVSKVTGRPSSGFYLLARRLRAEYRDLDAESIWEQERQRCYAAARPA